MPDMPDHGGKIRLSGFTEEGRVEVHADVTAAPDHFPDLFIGQVPRMIAQRTAAAVTGHGRCGAQAEEIPESGFIKMSRVHGHVLALHFTDDAPALGGQALRASGFGGVGQRVFVVPYDGHHADAAVIPVLDLLLAFLEQLAALHGEHEALLILTGFPGIKYLHEAFFQERGKRIQLGIHDAAHIPVPALGAGPQGKGLQRDAAGAHFVRCDHEVRRGRVMDTHGIESICVRIGKEHVKSSCLQ